MLRTSSSGADMYISASTLSGAGAAVDRQLWQRARQLVQVHVAGHAESAVCQYARVSMEVHGGSELTRSWGQQVYVIGTHNG